MLFINSPLNNLLIIQRLMILAVFGNPPCFHIITMQRVGMINIYYDVVMYELADKSIYVNLYFVNQVIPAFLQKIFIQETIQDLSMYL